MSTWYQYEEIAKIIFENMAVDPTISDSVLADIASRLEKDLISVRRIARIRKETESWRRQKAADPRARLVRNARSR